MTGRKTIRLPQPPFAWQTTNLPGFHGPNNCGPTCALNVLFFWQNALWRQAGIAAGDISGLHNQLYKLMGVGRLGAHVLKYRRGLMCFCSDTSLRMRVRPVFWVTAGFLHRELEAGRPVPLCLLRDAKYGWHWVLAIGLAREKGKWQVLIADGWQQQTVWIPLYSAKRLGVHALCIQPRKGVTDRALARSRAPG